MRVSAFDATALLALASRSPTYSNQPMGEARLDTN